VIRVPARPIAAIQKRVIVPGSGVEVKPGAVICPVPENDIGAGPLLGGGLAEPSALAKPLAPAKIPVPPRIVRAPVFDCALLPSGSLKVSRLVPLNVSAPPLNEALKLLAMETTPKPDGKNPNVMVPASE
jgi:hypothetical protein